MASHPPNYLIIGAGEFGLSTALSLLLRHRNKDIRITILDSSPHLPNPSGSSVDSSRIVRADYASAPYAKLALEAQSLWRDTSPSGWGGQNRYHEPGFLLTADEGMESYVWKSMSNVTTLIDRSKIQKLGGKEAIMQASGYAGSSGDWGYVNWSSGWADAEAVVAYALERVRAEGGDKVEILTGVQVERLIIDSRGRCEGAELADGRLIMGEQTIMAAGAWSGTLIDLRGRAVATGQPLAYIDISEKEQEKIGGRPTIMNMSRGMFVIPPTKRELKVARHGFGYRNLKRVPATWMKKSDGAESNGNVEEVEVSVPDVGFRIPKEAEEACREALREVLPEMADRPFARTRLCWYCDTPDGNFIITHHPEHKNLFVATGGSGHGFKFFPVIGEKIVDILECKQTEYAELWGWKEPVEGFVYCDDGSRAGPKGMLLYEELGK